MTPKEYLSQVHTLDVRISRLMKEKSELHSFDGVAGTDYSKDKVQSSPKGEANFVPVVERIVAIEAELDAKIDEYVDLKHRITAQIQELPNAQHIDLLQKKYIEGKRLEEIAVEMRYSYQYVRAMHGFALQEFNKKFPELFEVPTQ